MTVLDIVLEPNPILHEVCDSVTLFDENLQKFIDDMFDTMKANDGIGLASPQVGVLQRIFICQYKRKKLVCINPKILSASGSVIMEEACLSLPNILAEVHRYEKIQVQAQDRHGESFEMTLTGMMAIIFQHENDHLDGILITKSGKIIES
jgi:peptide deformylase